jgi:hypothetical protein
VRRGHATIIVSRVGELATIDVDRAREVASQIVREAEMIRDVRVQRADGHVARVWLAVGLDLVRLAADELRRALEICCREINLSHGQIPMAAVSIQPWIVRVEGDAARVDVDRLPDAAQVREAPPEPDDRVRIRWRMLISGTRFSELPFVAFARRGGQRQLAKGVSKKRDGLNARGKRCRASTAADDGRSATRHHSDGESDECRFEKRQNRLERKRSFTSHRMTPLPRRQCALNDEDGRKLWGARRSALDHLPLHASQRQVAPSSPARVGSRAKAGNRRTTRHR